MMKPPKHPAFNYIPGAYRPNGHLIGDSNKVQRIEDKSDWLKQLEEMQEAARGAKAQVESTEQAKIDNEFAKKVTTLKLPVKR